jgi:hypothetical protein
MSKKKDKVTKTPTKEKPAKTGNDPALNPNPAKPPDEGRQAHRDAVMARAEGRGKPPQEGDGKPEKRGRKKDPWKERRQELDATLPPDDIKVQWEGIADVITMVSAGFITLFFPGPDYVIDDDELETLNTAWVQYLSMKPPEDYEQFAEYILWLAYASMVLPRAVKRGYELYHNYKTKREDSKNVENKTRNQETIAKN